MVRRGRSPGSLSGENCLACRHDGVMDFSIAVSFCSSVVAETAFESSFRTSELPASLSALIC
eukprot:750346-Hanusia_phi.AAC.4